MASLGVLALLLAAVIGEPVTVMSFNVRGDFDGGVATDKPDGWLRRDGAHRREVLLDLVREADPDVLGVQEALANQAAELDDALAGHGVYGVGRDDGADAGEQCAIYYRTERFERVDSGTFWLSQTPDEPSTYPGAACPRLASWVVLRDRSAGGELLVINTHWDHVSAEAREHSASMIRERLAELAGGRPAIVMGDLNVTEEGEPVRTLLGPGEPRLLDAYRQVHPEPSPDEQTFHGFRGGDRGRRIDFILHTPGLRATDAAIVPDAPGGRYPSDHYPVTATFAPAAE